MSAADALLEGLDAHQRAAVTSTAAPLCILAGAGSGKTRVLTRRIGYRILSGTAEAERTLALTFTRKAAGELASRLGRMGVRSRIPAGTFHAVALAQMRRRWADRGEHVPALLDRKARIVAPLLGKASGNRATLLDAVGEIEWAKARMVTPDTYTAAADRHRRTPPLAAVEMAELFRRYELDKRKRGLVDFDDLLAGCAQAMEEDAEFAAAQRWQFRHLFVDEFQDVNPAQHRLLRAWLGDRVDLCVVGDPDQAIYSWNGADPTILTGFADAFPTAEVVRLDSNYRCSPQIVTVGRAVLGRRGPLPDVVGPPGPVPLVRAYPTEESEAAGIASMLRRAHGSRRWSQMAVLTRTNGQIVALQRAFHAAGVPARVRGAGFLELPEVAAALADLAKVGGHPDAVSSWATALEASVPEAPADRRPNLEALVGLAHEHRRLDPGGGPQAFRDWLTASTREDPAGTRDAVELCTFHRAKGLEWPLVVLAGIEEGLVPISHATDDDDALAEEQRLLYVAVTRAAEELHLTWAEQRLFGSRRTRRSPSPMLDDVETACQALSGRTEPDWRSGLDASRRQLRAADAAAARRPKAGKAVPAVVTEADEPLMDALKAWRREAAKVANVPAYVVFHDATLAAIATRRPRTSRELQALPGLGPVKAERYGDGVLEVVAAHAGP
ncbi:MAG TPA: ATP-dependent DNA helicase UvrD2 [Acidimicrobiales bacterium]|nr:ATP-dependent DNA helicase UvrD2 [Acidimicrobiales bacterium]